MKSSPHDNFALYRLAPNSYRYSERPNVDFAILCSLMVYDFVLKGTYFP